MRGAMSSDYHKWPHGEPPIPEMFDADAALEKALEKADQTALRKLQEKERAKIRKPNPMDARHTYGVRGVKIASSELGELDPSDENYAEAKEKLAEGYFLMGEIEAAIKHSARRRDEYQGYMDALTRKDGDWCGCPQRGNRYIKDKFLYKGRSRTLYRCNRCGFENAS